MKSPDPRVVLASGFSTAGCKACGKSVEESLVEQSVRIKTLVGGARPVRNGKVAVRLCDAKAPVFMRVRTVLRRFDSRGTLGCDEGCTKKLRIMFSGVACSMISLIYLLLSARGSVSSVRVGRK